MAYLAHRNRGSLYEGTHHVPCIVLVSQSVPIRENALTDFASFILPCAGITISGRSRLAILVADDRILDFISHALGALVPCQAESDDMTCPGRLT